MNRPMNQLAVSEASEMYIGTCGESATACTRKFVPAFRNNVDGRVERARFPDGKPAPMHLIAALPREWAVRCDEDGMVLEIGDNIEAGFLRDGRFYSRAEAAQETVKH